MQSLNDFFFVCVNTLVSSSIPDVQRKQPTVLWNATKITKENNIFDSDRSQKLKVSRCHNLRLSGANLARALNPHKSGLVLGLFKPSNCQAPTQLPTRSPLQFNSISTSSKFNSSKSWVGVMPYIWFSSPPTHPPPPVFFFNTINQVN